MKKSIIPFVALLSVVGCNSEINKEHHEEQVKIAPLSVPYEIGVTGHNDTVCFGGFGSSLSVDIADSSFYLLTDRGPNVDGKTPESKMFPFPDYSPTIGHFRKVGDSLVMVRKVILKQADGTPFLGLPNREGDGLTGEVAYDFDGNVITSDYRGIDSEGLTRCSDGSFCVSDEYAPFLLHFDADGTLLAEMSPGKGIPEHYAKRRPNRGMEGVSISKDQTRLYCVMQSPLYIPDSRTKDKSLNVRILEISLIDGTTREFLYQLQNPKLKISDICYVDDSALFILERDGKHAKGVKRIYAVDITNATDISNIKVETMADNELAEKGITPVSKTLAIDILKEIPEYSHDKVEGISLVNDNTIAIVNDDDFGTYETPDGGLKPKLNAKGEVDHAEIYFLNFDLCD